MNNYNFGLEQQSSLLKLKREIIRHCILSQYQFAIFCSKLNGNDLNDFGKDLFKLFSYGPFTDG